MIQAFITGFKTPGFWEMIGFLCAFFGALLVYAFVFIGCVLVGQYIIRRFDK